YISPKDLQNKSAYDNFNEVEQYDAVLTRKLVRMRQNHDWTLNKSRCQALFSSTVYSPSGTVTQNWDTEFAITRTAVDFVLGTP
ncbi:major capsid protein, partial [Lacticaseibacillus paracasei]